MNKIKAVIFDYDGIISESLNVKTDAFAEMYRPYGIEVEHKVIKYHEVHGSPIKKVTHIQNIIKKYNYGRSEVVFIGDATTGSDAARANQIKFIGRFKTNEEIKKEKYQVKDFTGFNKFLNTI
jgi:beta-phosphoglucomutase-like phosphatase (HAD superfamily)